MAEGGDKPREDPLLIHLAKLKKRSFAIGEFVFYRRTRDPNSWWPARVRNHVMLMKPFRASSGLYRFVHTLEGIGPSMNTTEEELSMGANDVRPFLNEPEEVNDIDRIMRWDQFDQIANHSWTVPQLMELFRRDLARGETRRLQQSSSKSSSALLTDFLRGNIPPRWSRGDSAPAKKLELPLIILKEAKPTLEERRARFAATRNIPEELDETTIKGTYEKPDIIQRYESAEKKRRRFAQSHTKGQTIDRPPSIELLEEETPSPGRSSFSSSSSPSGSNRFSSLQDSFLFSTTEESPGSSSLSATESSSLSTTASQPKSHTSSPKKEETLVSGEAAVSQAPAPLHEVKFKKGDLVFFRLTLHQRSWWPAQVVNYGRHEQGIIQIFLYGLSGLGSMMKEEDDQVPTDANMWRPVLNEPVLFVAYDPDRMLHWHQFDRLASDHSVAPPLIDLFRRDVARGEAMRRRQDSNSSSSSSSSSNVAPTVIPSSLIEFVRGTTPDKWQLAPHTNFNEVIEIYDIKTPQLFPEETLNPVRAALKKVGLAAQEKRAKYDSTVQEKAEDKPIEGAYEKPDLMISDESAEKKRKRFAQSHTRGQKTDLPPSHSAEVPPDSSPVRYLRPDISECPNLLSDMSPTPSQPKFQYSSSKKEETLVSGRAAVKRSMSVFERDNLVFYQLSDAPNSWWPAQVQRCKYEQVSEDSEKLVYTLASIGPKQWTNEDQVQGDKNEQRQFFNRLQSVGADEISRIIPWRQFNLLATNSEAAPMRLDLFRRDLARGAALWQQQSPSTSSSGSSSSSSIAARTVPPSLLEDFIRGITPPAWENAPTTSHTERSMPDGAQIQPPLPSDQQIVIDDSMGGHGRERPPLEVQDSGIPNEEANRAGCLDTKAHPAEGSDSMQPPLPSDQPIVVDSGNEKDREPLPGEEQQLDTPEVDTNVAGTGGHKADIEFGESLSKN